MSARFPFVFGSGPWVSRQGSHLPATTEDVVLKVDGKVVEIADLDPYAGAVRPVLPVVAGAVVEIEALTVAHAVLPLRLGYPGAVTGLVGMPYGPPGSRDRMTLLLGGPAPNPQPLKIAHRYIGQERTRATLTGDPAGFRLGRRVGACPPSPLGGKFVHIRASLDPDTFSSQWVEKGTGVLTASLDGIYGDSSQGVAIAAHPIPVRQGNRSFVTARVMVQDAGPSGPRVAIGLHDGSLLHLAALIDLQGFRHLGVLRAPSSLLDPAAYEIFPKLSLAAQDQVTLRVQGSQGLSRPLLVGDRFRISQGPQAGSYQIQRVERNDLVQTILTISPQLPIGVDKEGAKIFTGYVDLGQSASIWVLRVEVDSSQVKVSAVSAEASLTSLQVEFSPKLQDPLLLHGVTDTLTSGCAIFGTLLGKSLWQAVVAQSTGIHEPSQALNIETAPPLQLPAADWIEIPPAEIEPALGTLHIRGSSSPYPSGLVFASSLLSSGQMVQIRTETHITDESGAGDLWLEICDGVRRIILASVVITSEQGVDRVWIPDGVCLSKYKDPDLSGWTTQKGRWTSRDALVAVGDTESFVDLPGGELVRFSLQLDVLVGKGEFTLGGPDYGISFAIANGQLDLSAGLTYRKKYPITAGPLRVEIGLSPQGALFYLEGLAPISLSSSEITGGVRETFGSTIKVSAGTKLKRAAICLPPPASAIRSMGFLLDPQNLQDPSAWVLVPKEVHAQTSIHLLLDPAWGAVLVEPSKEPAGWVTDRIQNERTLLKIPYQECALVVPGTTRGVLIGVGPYGLGAVSYKNTTIRVSAREAPGEVGLQYDSLLGRSAPASSGEQFSGALPSSFTVPVRDGIAAIGAAGIKLKRVFRARRDEGAPWWEPPAIQLLPDGQVRLPDVYNGFAQIEGMPVRITNLETLKSFKVHGSPDEHFEDTPPFYPLWASVPTRKDISDPDSTGKSAAFDPLDIDKPILLLNTYTQQDDGVRQRIWIASDDPDDAPGQNPGDVIEEEEPGFSLEGYEETVRGPRDSTLAHTYVRGLFIPAGGKELGTPTMDKRGEKPAYVLAPAFLFPFEIF